MNTHPEHKCNYPPVRITIRSEGELCIEYEHAERCIENLERMRMAVEEGWYQPSELEQFAYSLLNNIPNFIKGKQMNDKGLEQWAWECDIKEDISKLIKFANRIHAEAFSTGYDAGVAYQQEVNLKIINRIINELKGKL